MIPNKGNQIFRLVDEDSKLKNIYCDPIPESYQNKKSLSVDTIKSITKNEVKPIPSRVDYNFFNYCSICELKYPKQVLRCRDCNQKVRTRPWHRSKIIDRKRI